MNQYEDVTITITSPGNAVNGKVHKASFSWRRFETLYAPLNNLNNKYQILGHTVCNISLSELKFPSESFTSFEAVRSSQAVSVTLIKDTQTILSVTNAFLQKRDKSNKPIVQGKFLLVKNLIYQAIL